MDSALKCLTAGLIFDRHTAPSRGLRGREADPVATGSSADAPANKKARREGGFGTKKKTAAAAAKWTEDEIRRYRRQRYINIYSRSTTRKDSSEQDGSTHSAGVPAPARTIAELHAVYKVPKWITRRLEQAFGFSSLTSIQQQAIPCLLEGFSLLASAPTGSGKTLAFLVPIVTLMLREKTTKKKRVRCLIVVPSRELAIQIISQFDRLVGEGTALSGDTLFSVPTAAAVSTKKKKGGGVKDADSTNTSKAKIVVPKCDLVASTPLRLVTLVEDSLLSLKALQYLILDEADRLLDHGFAPQIDRLLTHVDLEKTTRISMFSATLPEGVLQMADTLVPAAIRISVGRNMSAASDIEQRLVFVTSEAGKLAILRQLLHEGHLAPPVLIFLQSIERVTELAQALRDDSSGGWARVGAMHSEQTKAERDAQVEKLKNKELWFLLCTDLMCRGVDFPDVKTVVNWDLPQSAAAYIHRVGRTGRAGQKGKALTLFTLSDSPYLPAIVNVMRQSGCDVPEWLLHLRKAKRNERKAFQRRGLRRRPIVYKERKNKKEAEKES